MRMVVMSTCVCYTSSVDTSRSAASASIRMSGMLGAMKKRRGGGKKKAALTASQMARKRWSKLSAERRREYALKMVEAKRLKRLARLKKPDEPPGS
jgi:hypothetical protein